MHQATRQRLETVYQQRIELAEKMAARSKTAEGRLKALAWKIQWEKDIKELQNSRE